MAVKHEDTAVVHAKPHVLLLVGDHAEYAVVKVRDVTGVTGLVVVEFVAVEARQSVPSGYPDVAVVILDDMGNGITGQTVVGGVVRQRSLQLLCADCQLHKCGKEGYQ